MAVTYRRARARRCPTEPGLQAGWYVQWGVRRQHAGPLAIFRLRDSEQWTRRSEQCCAYRAGRLRAIAKPTPHR